MNIGKDLVEFLAVLRREAEDPVILLVVILALMVGIAWLDRYESRNDPVMAARCLKPDAPSAMCGDLGYPTAQIADDLSATTKRRSNDQK
jgi:hypothetical protein